ncbi:MAG TPA: hypothetical protein VH877_20580 [Polyangia bacterium]|jgi:hypothetical protein|nr:hypothetical protein [Polyangia bacterium]
MTTTMKTMGKSRLRAHLSAGGFVFLLGAVAGCGASSENDNVSAALDSLESANSEGTLLAVALDGATSAMSADEVAQNAAANAGRYLVPAGCVSAQATGASVAYTLNRCSGPYGLFDLTGRVTASFSIQTSGVQVSLASTGLRINGAMVDFQSTAVYSTSGSGRSLSLNSTSTGAGARGSQFRRVGDYTASWDGSCLDLDGVWTTSAFGRTWSTTVANYRHCTGRCPEVGGTITLSGDILGGPITLSYDGDSTARWATANGRSGVTPVACGL